MLLACWRPDEVMCGNTKVVWGPNVAGLAIYSYGEQRRTHVAGGVSNE